MSLIDSFMVWWLRSNRYNWSKFRRSLFERGYLKTILPSVSSLDEIETSLRQVTWTMDGPLHLFDSISYPQVTWAKKKDDCDGFAVLAANLLNQWNPECKPALVTAMVRPLRSSHTVCAFQSPQNNLWFFDNYYLRKEDCNSYEEVVNKVAHNTQKLICWDVRDPLTLEIIQFNRNK